MCCLTLCVQSFCSVGITCAIRAGHVVGGGDGRSAKKNPLGPSSEQVSYYEASTESNKIASCRIRYATRDKLEPLGLLSSAPAAGSSQLPPPPAPDKYSAAHMEESLNFYFGASSFLRALLPARASSRDALHSSRSGGHAHHPQCS